MNRQTILESIDRHLRESFAKSGEARPLGEIVAKVASDIRQSATPSTATGETATGEAATGETATGETATGEVVTARVIPIELVAAFVDGQLSESEISIICQAVLVDNSVLAELIAAVRATRETIEQLPPLSDSLSAQLMALRGRLPESAGEAAASEEPIQHAPQSTSSVIAPAVNIQATTTNGRVQPRTSRKPKRFAIAIAVLALAATILAGFYMANRQETETPIDDRLVEHDSSLPEIGPQRSVPPEDKIATENDHQPRGEEGELMVVGVDPVNAIDPVAPEIPDVVVPENIGQDDNSPEPMVPTIAEIPKLDKSVPSTPSTPPARQLAPMRWTEVTGLLARKELSGGVTAQRAAAWKSVPSSSAEPDLDSNRRVSLRTMPMSRAEAEFEGGGRVVLAADSGMLITRADSRSSASIDLHHGALAMVDLPEGTVIELTSGGKVVASLKWTEKATAVLRRAAEGFNIDIDHGEIVINDKAHRDESLTIAQDQSVQSIQRPKRLPTWVDRPVDSIGIPRTILAQISQSDNVTQTLNQRINELGSAQRLSANDQATLTALASWQAAMADTNLFRLANSRIPAMRLAALQRLVNMPTNDPRYRRTWINIERMTANKQRVAQIRRWCELARMGVKPNAAQAEQMISGLSSQDVAGRAMADFMLRQFYGNQVPFDPTWTAQQQQRAMSVWRQRLGLPTDVRGAAPAATLAPNRP